jgi:membrane-bound metal-dependent hydrolase YbcI (DUF457 family)
MHSCDQGTFEFEWEIKRGEGMTGKTHMAISAAATSVLLSAAETFLPGIAAERPDLHPSAVPLEPHALATAGLLLLGVVAGLFPDLDAPDTELQHLPRRASKHLERYIRAGIPKRSAQGRLAREVARYATLPLTLSIDVIGRVIRAFTAHRGFTHTLWGAAVFTGLAAGAAFLLTGSARSAGSVGLVWLAGYASHLAADACTPSGIPLFGVAREVRPGPRRYSLCANGTAQSRPSRARVVHLLPKRMRIRTGSLADTLIVRWVSWAVFVAAALWALDLGTG